MNTLLKEKTSGYKMILATILMTIITLIVYVAIYRSSKYISWEGVRVLALGTVLAILLLWFRLQRFVPAVLLITSFGALLFHIYYIYFFISSVLTGIQFSGFPASFFVNFAFFGITVVMSIICVFLPVEK